MTTNDVVGVVLRDQPAELPVARAACTVNAHLDPEDVARQVKLAQRGDVREFLEAAGLEDRYTVSVVFVVVPPL